LDNSKKISISKVFKDDENKNKRFEKSQDNWNMKRIDILAQKNQQMINEIK